jgi:putative sterol carrier protein
MVRPVTVDDIIRRFPRFVDTWGAAGVTGVVRWELIGAGGRIDRFTLLVDDGAVKVGRELTDPPQVTLRLDVIGFLKLAQGTGDPSTMALAGDLEIDGDAWFALDLLRLFWIPTSNGVVRLGGPAKVDVGAVARLVRVLPDRYLRPRLHGAVRQILLDEIFERMPQYLDERRAAGVDALVSWQITGRPGGGLDEYRTLVRAGTCTVGARPELPGRPRVSIRTEPAVFLKLVTGNAQPVSAFLRRRLSIKGDLLFASRLPRIFRIPSG